MISVQSILASCSGHLRRWSHDKSGNVAMMFGLAFMPLTMAVGVAVDLAQESRVQQKLAGMADAIALAAARSYDDPDIRQTIGNVYLDANLGEGYGPDVTISNLTVEFDDETEIVTVTIQADVPTMVLNLVGIDEMQLETRSRVTYEGHVSEPVSLALVLDVSGSMSWNGKIGTLRTAATHLLDKLQVADPDDIYVRSGLVTYYSQIRQTVRMDWGITHTRNVVQGLWASGGTRSTRAVRRAGRWLTDGTEQEEHESQPVHEGEEFELHRFMIFMTDGDNNYSSDDDATEELCDEYKEDGVEIFSVAFEAPAGGRALLEYCASTEEHYYDADNSEEFLAAFDEIGDRIEAAFLRIVE